MTPTERESTTDELLEQALIYIDSLHEMIENTQSQAIAEHDKARNQAIDDVIKRLSIMVHYGNIDLSWSFIKEEIEQLKTKP